MTIISLHLFVMRKRHDRIEMKSSTATAASPDPGPPPISRTTTPYSKTTSSSTSMVESPYASIPSFNKYSDLTQDKNYVRLPSDWYVIVSDIEGSTGYIEQGRYRDVNTVGAMGIAAARNALDGDFPFVFGGDGATLVVHPDQHEAATTALLAVQRGLVQNNYGMKLRVGSVLIAELERQGTCVEVARYEITAGMCIAMFRGGGLALADTIVKSTGQLEQTALSQACIPCLDSLSCRWEKIPNRNGCVLTILVMDNVNANDRSSTYGSVLQLIEAIINEKNNPVNIGSEFNSYKTAANTLRDESRMHESLWCMAFFKRLLEILLCVVIFRWKRWHHYLFLDAPSYMEDMRTHADYRKFDDMIRMVVDCTEEQADAMEELLRDLYEEGRHIYYGTHRSSNTLMTCLVENMDSGHHIHFVDGDLGGYAIAAKTLKQQLKEDVE